MDRRPATARHKQGLHHVEVAEPPQTTGSQSEEAYRRIRDRIVCLDMRPGSVVHEARLREELDIGRTPIREALQRLAWENLVKSVPHRGTFVTDVNITDLARITEVRVVLEGHAARLAAERAGTKDRAAIGELLDELESAGTAGRELEGQGGVPRTGSARLAAPRQGGATGAGSARHAAARGEVPPQTDERELMRLDQRIHRAIYKAARNSFLEGTLERYFNLSLRLWFMVIDREVRLREAVEVHVVLLRAVLAGDGAQAEESMRRHVTGFEREIRKVLVER